MIYQYDDYRQFLRDWIQAQPSRGHGMRSRMAQRMGCHTAYVTQVLQGRAHLSPEQAEALVDMLGINDYGAEYFHQLVRLGRSGSERLRKRLQTKLRELKKRSLSLKDRLEVKEELGEADQTQFFSRWYIPAIQMALTNPALRSRERIARALGLNIKIVDETLAFLLSRGLASERGPELLPNLARIFVSNESPIINSHHLNWRLRAAASLDHARPTDLHFTSIFSLSKIDAARIRENLVAQIAESRGIVKDSVEEELHTICIDFFRVDVGR